MKKLFILFMVISFALVGCSDSEKTAKQNGSGISVEIGDNDNIRYLNLTLYVDGLFWGSEEVISEENESFQNQGIFWFNTPTFQNIDVEIELIYSENMDGTNSQITNKIDITQAKKWVNIKLNDELQLEILEFK
ncbi:hypothetical protein JOD29_002022 [Lysinibacillus composti]|uniref:Uncharacterized protein n=1 Tax=Lysinibacillus composti TaxID=720633 RepID=A0A3N9UEQ5_9BACI|nr:hypothetical protein [Lysinibacillus composti]MBM7608775.1 hypothetical protein [Lysinibacillus composti]RQW74678.1 hypothetical protein EBB45_10650 [Lysinibacillus composti]